MKTIQLTQGQVAIVDDEDYEWLSQWKWTADWSSKTSSFRARRNVYRKSKKPTVIRMARVILNLKTGDKRQVDHINHNTLDNRRCNLRICTNQQNARNRYKRKKNNRGHKVTSNFIGVCWSKQNKKWIAQITDRGKHFHLGSFNSEIEAAKAYDKKAIELSNEFANVNFERLKK